LASIGTCVGYFVLSFCQSRGIPSDKLGVTLHAEKDTRSRLVEDIMISLHVPKDFPEKYREGIVRAAGSCLVKKHMEHPPKFSINVVHAK
jgi:putative redox protein